MSTTDPDRIYDSVAEVSASAETSRSWLLAQIADYQMREQIAKEANDKMRAELETLRAQLAEKEARIEELTDEHTELCGRLDMAWHRTEIAEAKIERLAAALEFALAGTKRATNDLNLNSVQKVISEALTVNAQLAVNMVTESRERMNGYDDAQRTRLEAEGRAAIASARPTISAEDHPLVFDTQWKDFFATILRQVGCPVDSDTDAIAAWRDSMRATLAK